MSNNCSYIDDTQFPADLKYTSWYKTSTVLG
jgi:hypothetical protein